ncbi:NXPE family member 3-like [Diadema antillarum]|uniref:NXPE family member 3-like n=1 Tax=Diadema antillarum TaxID=105358 RepID=UPI003A8A3B2B
MHIANMGNKMKLCWIASSVIAVALILMVREHLSSDILRRTHIIPIRPRLHLSQVLVRGGPEQKQVIMDSRHNGTTSASKNGSIMASGFVMTSSTLSSYEILPNKKAFNLNDRIQVRITARDTSGRVRHSGGDYFRAKLVSTDLMAASRSEGEIVDFNNGTYLAEFVLRWPGSASVSVMLVHGAGAVSILDRLQREHPSRASYLGVFKRGTVRETTKCNVNHVSSLDNECDFTDREYGIPWFCQRPKNLSCKEWYWHKSDNDNMYNEQTNYLSDGEAEFFKEHKALLPCRFCKFTISTLQKSVKPDKHGRLPWQQAWNGLPKCVPAGVRKFENSSAGYYYRDKWFSNRCRNCDFTQKEAENCLRNKSVLLIGDSTSRILIEYLTSALKGETDKVPNCITHMTRRDLNASVYFKFHGLPTRGTNGGPKKCTSEHVATVLDHLNFVPDVFMLSVTSHFSVHSFDFFRERMRVIRKSVERLHQRHPNVLFLLKSANTREFSKLSHILSNSEWYIYTMDRIVRETFADNPNVGFIDTWDMTAAQLHKDQIHPVKEVTRNVVNMLLSYVCPT